MSVLQWLQLSLFGSAGETPEPIQTATAPHSLHHTPERQHSKKMEMPPGDVWQTALLCATKPVRLLFVSRGTTTWSLQWRPQEGLTLRLPPTLRMPPLDIAQSLVEWAMVVSRRRRNAESKIQKKQMETKIREYLDASLLRDPVWKKREAKKATRRLEKLQPKGRYHDLQACFDAINQEYFQGNLRAQVTWSHKLGGLSTHCEKSAPDGSPYHLITVSQGYDAPDVTPDILGGVMYHECLHIVHPPVLVHSRRVVHGSAFRKAEKQYRHFDVWMHWHRHGLPRSLRNLRRLKKKSP
jgi:hypothetical protein